MKTIAEAPNTTQIDIKNLFDCIASITNEGYGAITVTFQRYDKNATPFMKVSIYTPKTNHCEGDDFGLAFESLITRLGQLTNPETVQQTFESLPIFTPTLRPEQDKAERPVK